METYILKSVFCSALMFAFYVCFLSKEKTFVFNRFYLLASVLLSLLLPFIRIEMNTVQEKSAVFPVENFSEIRILIQAQAENSFNFLSILKIFYVLAVIFFLIKIAFGIFQITRLSGKKIIYKNQNLLLLDKNLPPFSFWKTMYINKGSFQNNQVNDFIFQHEEIHIRQLHTADLLFIEIVKAFFWFNPVFYLMKKSMVENHEFIADSCVVSAKSDIKNYQKTILQEILKQNNFKLIHQFNYSNTKKRFIMMTNKNSKFAGLKNYLSLPVIALSAFIFSEKVYAGSFEPLKIPEKAELSRLILSPENQGDEKTILSTETEPQKVLLDTISPKKTVTEKAQSRVQNQAAETTTSQITTTVQEEISQVTTVPEYPGGMNSFRQNLTKDLDMSAFKKTGIVKTIVVFKISEKGEVYDIKTMGNNEVFNNLLFQSVKKANENILWKPATQNGTPVIYNFKLPVTMTFTSGDKPM